MEQNSYWAGQQRKIIDQMAREGLINNRKDLSFTLTDKTFVINGLVQSGDVFERYRREYVPADADDNWSWNYPGVPGYYSAEANRYRNSDAYYRSSSEERQRLEAERDKKLVADLMQDGLITDPNNVTFTLTDKKVTINGKKQSDKMYKKYKEKYMPGNTGTNWSWNYSHH
jgi:predicted transcriptional regulator